VALDEDLVAELQPIPGEVARQLDVADLTAALESAWRAVRRLNRYVEEQQPWALAKSGDDEALQRVLATLVEGLRVVAVLLHPWMPESAGRILEALGAPELDYEGALPAAGNARSVQRLAPLFPKHDA
jgi:methionyl-tRNA synthetase